MPVNIIEAYPRPVMFLAMCLFGLIGVLAAGVTLPSSVIVLGRAVIGTLFILSVILVAGNRISKENIRSNIKPLVLSGIILGLNWLALFEAYKQTSVSVATLCNYMAPAFIILVSPVILKERFTVTKLICVIISIIGLAFTSGIIQNGLNGSVNTFGIALGLAAAALYCGMVMCNKKLGEIGSCDRTLVQLAVSAVVVLIYCLFTVDFPSLTFTTEDIIRVIILGVVTTGCTFLLYFGSMAYLPAQTTAVYGYMEPVVTLFLSAVILGEQLGVYGWIGALLILGSTLVGSLPEKEPESHPV